MKKLLLTVVITSLSTAGIYGATTEIKATRLVPYPRATFVGMFTPNVGLYTSLGFRTNAYFRKKINGATVDREAEGLWLTEFFVGPLVTYRPVKKLILLSIPRYRVLNFNTSETKAAYADRYTRHTISWVNTIRYDLDFVALVYTFHPWYRFKTEKVTAGVTSKVDASFWTQHYFGFSFPVYKDLLRFIIADELLLNHSYEKAEEETLFTGNVIYGLFLIRPFPHVNILTGYAYYLYRPISGNNTLYRVDDHYLYAEVIYTMRFF